jgi:hypothetical protein
MRIKSIEERVGQAQRASSGDRLRHQIEAVGGSKDQWETGVWHMDKEQWHLLWTCEQAFWQAVPLLLAEGHGTVEGLTEHRKSRSGQQI